VNTCWARWVPDVNSGSVLSSKLESWSVSGVTGGRRFLRSLKATYRNSNFEPTTGQVWSERPAAPCKPGELWHQWQFKGIPANGVGLHTRESPFLFNSYPAMWI